MPGLNGMMSGATTPGALTRRAVLACAATLLAAPCVGVAAGPARAAASGPATAYMKNRIAKDLFGAARAKTPESFLRTINRHADLNAISTYSLGNYSDRLTSRTSARLRRGVAGFMSRYFAQQARKYPVVRADITGERPYNDNDVVVKTRIHLKSGSSYAVDWLLAPHGKRYKIRDVRVYGFWLSPFQRKLFVRYIADNNGDVTALLAALRV